MDTALPIGAFHGDITTHGSMIHGMAPHGDSVLRGAGDLHGDLVLHGVRAGDLRGDSGPHGDRAGIQDQAGARHQSPLPQDRRARMHTQAPATASVQWHHSQPIK